MVASSQKAIQHKSIPIQTGHMALNFLRSVHLYICSCLVRCFFSRDLSKECPASEHQSISVLGTHSIDISQDLKPSTIRFCFSGSIIPQNVSHIQGLFEEYVAFIKNKLRERQLFLLDRLSRTIENEKERNSKTATFTDEIKNILNVRIRVAAGG